MTLHIKVGGAWKEADEIHVKVGGVWKTVAEIQTKVGGAWKVSYAPVTETLVATAMSASDVAGYAIAQMRFKTDGSVNSYTTTAGENTSYHTGEWCDSEPSTDASLYEIRVASTIYEGTLSLPAVCSPKGTWGSLDTANLNFSAVQASSGTNFNAHNMEIREKANHSNIVYFTMSLDAEVY